MKVRFRLLLCALLVLALTACISVNVEYPDFSENIPPVTGEELPDTGEGEQAGGIFRLTFINVGQGDSALLVDPHGFTVLIDGGKPTAGETVVSYLRSQSISQINVMVVSHPDSDHLGGLVDVVELDDISVRSVVYSGFPGTTKLWDRFVNAVAAEGIQMRAAQAGEPLRWGEFRATVLYPTAETRDSDDPNEECLVVNVAAGNVRTLFACDTDFKTEERILWSSDPQDLRAEILKVSHHGSSLDTGLPFLDAIHPKEAVISVGKNSYGHPGADLLARLEDAGARIWRTDELGDITIYTDGARYQVNQPLRAGQGTAVQPDTPPVEAPQPGSGDEKDVQITAVQADGSKKGEPDEYVEIHNSGSTPVAIVGWTLEDNAGHLFVFPDFVLQPQQVCRVYRILAQKATR